MLSFDEALDCVRHAAPRLPSESVLLDAALGRVLAQELRSSAPLPAWDYSAMDGFAVRSTSFTGESPWLFPVVGESRTGRQPPVLESGAVCRIFTGAQLPEGADAVVMQEDVTVSEGSAAFNRRPAPFEHVRRAGEDLPLGALALETGTRLGPYQLGLVASLDRDRVLVARRPRVTILCTGDELRKAGTPARAASIPESNSIVVAALATSAGASVTIAEGSSDTLDETRAKISAALDASDLLITIGGVSVGEYDVVRPALEAAGVTLEMHKVAMKPGKPLTLGRRGDTVVLGLPGNPVSAQVTFALFGLPLLRIMQGDRAAMAKARSFRLGAAIRQKQGRRGFYAAAVDGDVVTPLAGQASGSTVNLAHAGALIVVPEDSSGYAAEQSVNAYVLSEL
jgi:molybdopterin molybdotransferase